MSRRITSHTNSRLPSRTAETVMYLSVGGLFGSGHSLKVNTGLGTAPCTSTPTAGKSLATRQKHPGTHRRNNDMPEEIARIRLPFGTSIRPKCLDSFAQFIRDPIAKLVERVVRVDPVDCGER